MPKWTNLPPCTEPHIGCLNCGGGEMRRAGKRIIASMKTRLYGPECVIRRDGSLWFCPAYGDGVEWTDNRTLMFIELQARKEPNHDWRFAFRGPLRDATYQRQGRNEWVLVESGDGYA